MGKIYYRNKGGIGNQLFIYFFAKALSLQFSKNLFVDNYTGFKRDFYKRKPLISSVISDNFLNAPFFIEFLFRIYRFLPQRFLSFFGVLVISEIHNRELVHFNEKDILEKNLILIDGYFQSYTYFCEIQSEITSKAFVGFEVLNDYLSYFNLIKFSNSVSIHIRRSQYDNLLDLNYYKNALNILGKNVEDCKYFIFSDDIIWCRENFKGRSFIFIDVAFPDEIQELYLMSICKHHIIANSSFSWWGAFLGYSSVYKFVIAPQKTDIGVLGLLYPKNWFII